MGENNDAGDTRERGIITSSDRDYLKLSEEERKDAYSRSARTQRRDAIRKRVWNAFLDGQILFNEVGDEQRRRLFDGWREFADSVESDADDSRTSNFYDVAESRGRWVEKIDGERGLAGHLAFLYLGLAQSDEYEFERLLRMAVERAERSCGRDLSDFELRIETESQSSVEELRARFDEREELTASEIKRLREAEEITADDLAAYYDEFTDLGGR